jgi:hypothetical protein
MVRLYIVVTWKLSTPNSRYYRIPKGQLYWLCLYCGEFHLWPQEHFRKYCNKYCFYNFHNDKKYMKKDLKEK